MVKRALGDAIMLGRSRVRFIGLRSNIVGEYNWE